MVGRKIKNKKKNIYVETINEMLHLAKHTLVKEMNKVAVLIQILIPVILSGIETNIFVLFVISALLYIVIAYVKEISYKLNSTTTKGIPIPYKPFIKTDGEVININEEDMEEAMLYLADVEEYLKSKGWL